MQSMQQKRQDRCFTQTSNRFHGGCQAICSKLRYATWGRIVALCSGFSCREKSNDGCYVKCAAPCVTPAIGSDLLNVGKRDFELAQE